MPKRHALVVFRVDAWLLAIELGVVEHVLWMVELIAVPSAPDMIAGLMNFHGKYIPVVDVRRRLGRPGRRFGLDDRLIVVRTGALWLALAVDAVEEILEVSEESVQEIDWISEATPQLSSVFTNKGQAVLIQDVGAWLSGEDEVRLQEILARLQPVDHGASDRESTEAEAEG